MICYKDKTFCHRSRECDKKDCYRNFTIEEEEIAANKGLPVSFSDYSDCEDFIEVKVTEVKR